MTASDEGKTQTEALSMVVQTVCQMSNGGDFDETDKLRRFRGCRDPPTSALHFSI